MSSSLAGEVVSYLRSHRTFDIDTSPSECGAVVLASADALGVHDFWVDGEGRDWPDDPHADDGGYYVVPGVDLVGAVEGFDPDGKLIEARDLLGRLGADLRAVAKRSTDQQEHAS
jgi:hypothetical protein